MTVNNGSDFSGVKVGDRLWLRCDRYEGPCIVDIAPNANYFRVSYPEWVQTVYTNGRINLNGPQVLFYDKVEIIPPPRPKRLVKTTIEVRPYYSKDYGGMGLTTFGLDDTQWTNWLGPVQTIEIEVEE